MLEVKIMHKVLWELQGKRLGMSEMPSKVTLGPNAERGVCVSLAKQGQKWQSVPWGKGKWA